MKVIISTLLLFYIGVVSLSTDDEKLRLVKLAFGNDISSRHFTESFDLTKSTVAHRSFMMSSSTDVHHFACSTRVNATCVSNELDELFGSENVQTVFISRTDDAVCFVVVVPAKSSSLAVSLLNMLLVWMPLPVEAKVTDSLAAHLVGMQPTESSAYPFELELTFGLGTSLKGLLNLTMDKAIDSIVQALQVSDLAQLIQTRNKFHTSKTRRVLSQASLDLSHMSSQSIYSACRFNDLNFSAVSPARVLLTVSSPSNMSSSDLDTSCLAALVAVIVDTEGCLLVSEAVKYKPLNDAVSQVIQSGGFDGGKIYHDIGLKGDGIVIGIAGNQHITVNSISMISHSFRYWDR
jgi:hypothetical protein